MKNYFLRHAITAGVLLFNVIVSNGQARIQKHFPKFDDKIDACLFAANAQDRTQGAGFSEIEFLNKDTLRIINHTPSPAIGGITLTILLDSNLNIIRIAYNEWAEVSNGYDKAFSVESPSVLLNFNPFKMGLTGLQGRYNFIIKTDYTPDEKLVSQGETPGTDYKLFYGRFK